MQIQILSVTPSQQPTKTPGKTYSQLEVAFKNLTFQGKVEGKKLVGFGANKAAFDALSKANSGEIYEISVKKNDNGYNDWVDAVKDGAPTNASNSPAPTYAPSNPNRGNNTVAGTTSPKSTYETPEERAKKQVYIVRQSSISNAIDLLSVGQKSPPDIDKVLSAASQFENFVFGGTAAPDKEVAKSFFPDTPTPGNTDLDDDIPF